jgi:hypothetical protein
MYVFKEYCRIIHGRTYFQSTAEKMDTCFKIPAVEKYCRADTFKHYLTIGGRPAR